MLSPGTVLQGRYTILRTLGVGGMGAAYLAQDMRLASRQIAVKEMIPDPTASPADQAQARQQFQLEASMLSSLDHPNLPRVSDYFTERGNHYLVMDYVDGQTLEDIMDRTPGSMPEDQIINWAIQLCDVLTYLHSRQPPVIFRDLKPGNIMVDRGGTVKLIDFGIARFFKPGKKTDTLKMGTMGYAPPEQYVGKGQTDARSDIYSLGATLHHLLTGRDPTEHPPFSFDSAPPRSLNPAISPHIEATIIKALAYDRAQRFQSASEMRRALLAPGGPAVGVAPSEAKSLPWVAIGGVAVIVLVVIAVLVSSVVIEGIRLIELHATQTAEARVTQTNEAGHTVPVASITDATQTAETQRTATAVALVTQAAESQRTATAAAFATQTAQVQHTTTAQAMTATAEKIAADEATATAAFATTTLAGKIAFHSGRDGNDEIYVMNADGSNQTRLTHHPGSDAFPALSPDGRRIAFVSDRDGDWEIYVVNADGSNQTRLTYDPAQDRLPAWSPDSTKIAFNSDRAGNLDLYMMNADGSDLARLTSGPARDGHATWSPDGRWIAFNSGPREDEWEIYIVAATGDDWLRLTDNSVIDWAPSWSPDGSHILFLSKRPNNADIYLMEANGSNQKRIFGGPGYEWGAVWSPDGQYIAFTSDQSAEDDIYIMRADGSDVRQLTYDGGAYPSWSK